MFKLIKDNFKKTNNCIILVTPLIIFLSIISWYICYASESINSTPKLILAVITTYIMISGLMAAWLYMVKKTMALSNKIFLFDNDRMKAIGQLILSLPKGIGKLFPSILGFFSIYIAIWTICLVFINLLITRFIGVLHFSGFSYEGVFVDTTTLYNKFVNLSVHSLFTLDCWIISIFLLTLAITFITFFWIPEIVYSEKNPVYALKNSIVKIFTNFKDSMFLYTFVVFINITVSCVNTILMSNPILYLLVLMVYYYSQVYLVVLIFTYYEQKFIKSNE